jgi:hypothetical protein
MTSSIGGDAQKIFAQAASRVHAVSSLVQASRFTAG